MLHLLGSLEYATNMVAWLLTSCRCSSLAFKEVVRSIHSLGLSHAVGRVHLLQPTLFTII